MNNRWGEREPWQTDAWLAATTHLFDLLLERARGGEDGEAREGLRSLIALAEEADGRADELVVFEETGAREHLGHVLQLAVDFVGVARRSGDGADAN